MLLLSIYGVHVHGVLHVCTPNIFILQYVHSMCACLHVYMCVNFCLHNSLILIQLVVRYSTTMHTWPLSELFSRAHIQQLAQEIMKLVCIVPYMYTVHVHVHVSIVYTMRIHVHVHVQFMYCIHCT